MGLGFGQRTLIALASVLALQQAPAQAQEIRIGGGYVSGELSKPMDITPFGRALVQEQGVGAQGFYSSLRVSRRIGAFELEFDGLFNLYWTNRKLATKDGVRRVAGKSTYLSLTTKGPLVAGVFRPIIGMYGQAVPALDAWVGTDSLGNNYPGFGQPFTPAMHGSFGAEAIPVRDATVSIIYSRGRLFDSRLASEDRGKQRLELSAGYDGYRSGYPLEVRLTYATEGKLLFEEHSIRTITGSFALGPFRSYLPGVEIHVSHRGADGRTGTFTGVPLNATTKEAGIGAFFRF